jgi:hypothetical protein
MATARQDLTKAEELQEFKDGNNSGKLLGMLRMRLLSKEYGDEGEKKNMDMDDRPACSKGARGCSGAAFR